MTIEKAKENVRNGVQCYYNREQVLELLERIKESPKKPLTLFDEALQSM
jgi:hypothetical protein